MKPWLRWALAGTVLASIAAIFVPNPDASDAADSLLPPRVSMPSGPAQAQTARAGPANASPAEAGTPAAHPPANSTLPAARWPAPWPLPEPSAVAAWSGPHEEAAAPARVPMNQAKTQEVRPAAVATAAADAASAPAAPDTKAPPAFPYRWIGRLHDGSDVQAFLANAQTTISVRAGDLVDQQWRVEKVGDNRLDVVWVATGDLIQVRLS